MLLRHCLFSICIFCSAVNASENLFTQQPTVTPSYARSGEHMVGVQTLQLTNPAQLGGDFQTRVDRNLTIEVWYPASKLKSESKRASYKDVTRSGLAFELAGEAFRDQPIINSKTAFPLIVMSHGYTGYRSIMFYLAEHLASHGYVVASIDHTDSTNAEVDFNKNAGAGFASTLYNRARDQQFVLNRLIQESQFKSAIDADSAAVIGYSMGGYGALNTVGGCYQFTTEQLIAMQFPESAAGFLAPLFSSCNAGNSDVDPRWKAMIAYAPWGGQQAVHDLSKVRVPSLFVAGELDDVSGYKDGVEALFKANSAEDKYLLVYENARHNIAAHPAPKVAYSNDLDIGHYYEPSWNSETITRINEHISLAFLNCHVKRQSSACQMLPNRERATQLKQSDGKLDSPWPGFPERWATGLRFYRGEAN